LTGCCGGSQRVQGSLYCSHS